MVRSGAVWFTLKSSTAVQHVKKHALSTRSISFYNTHSSHAETGTGAGTGHVQPYVYVQLSSVVSAISDSRLADSLEHSLALRSGVNRNGTLCV